MAAFDDSTDPALGAACNRLAAFCEALPADVIVDDASGLTESDLVLILRNLYATRQNVPLEELTIEQAAARYATAPPSPPTARRSPWARDDG